MIICSHSNQPLEQEACLACALQGGPCGYDYALLKAIYGSSEQAARASEIHVTDLTGCPLRAFWDKTNPAPERPHEMLVRWMGSGFHAMVEGSDKNVMSELPLAYKDIVGRTDLFYPEEGRVVDLKFTRWIYPDKLPYGSHVLQVNIYAWMLLRQNHDVRRVQIQYIDASGPTKCRKCRVAVQNINGVLTCPTCLSAPKNAHLGAVLVDVPLYSDQEIEATILQRKENLQMALMMGFAPEPEPGFLCAYCAHAAHCEAANSEV